VSFGGDLDTLGFGALAHHSEVVRRTGGLQANRGILGRVIQPSQHALVLGWAYHLAPADLLAAAGRHEQEQVQRARANRYSEIENAGQLLKVVFCDGGVDLNGHPGGFAVIDPSQSRVECSGQAPE